MEQLVYTVTAVCSDDAQLSSLGKLLDNVSWLTEWHAWLDDGDGLVETLSRGLNQHDVLLGVCLWSDVVGLVDVAVVTFVVESNVNVDDITVLKWSLIWDTVADDFVDGGAHRLWETAVVQWRWVRLESVSGWIPKPIAFPPRMCSLRFSRYKPRGRFCQSRP